jgi:hypothetical protein
MARNRKYQSAAIRFGPALKALVLCLLVGGSGVGYVWQKNQIFELGRQTTAREAKLAALEEQNEKFRKQLSHMRSTPMLLLQTKALGLSEPPHSQVWTLPEPAREPMKKTAEKATRQDMVSR